MLSTGQNAAVLPTLSRLPEPLSFYDNSYGGAPRAQVTFSGTVPKSLPSGQFIISSRIPRKSGFLIQARCVISATHLLHLALVL